MKKISKPLIDEDGEVCSLSFNDNVRFSMGKFYNTRVEAVLREGLAQGKI